MLVAYCGRIDIGRTRPSGIEPRQLTDEAIAKRFCAWRGVTGRRYIASVFAANPETGDCGLPWFDACILIAVAANGSRRSILSVCAIEQESERRAAIASGRTASVDEWHVHFLADTPHARGTAAADLAERHLTSEQADRA